MRQTMIFPWWWLGLLVTLSPASVVPQGDSAVVQVVQVIDGNTIEVCCVLGDREKVRYIGTDTPPSILQKGSYITARRRPRPTASWSKGKRSPSISTYSNGTNMAASWLTSSYGTARS